ncbi:MAG: hypothetical protein ACQERC_12225 [Bacteroidota bacterium]
MKNIAFTILVLTVLSSCSSSSFSKVPKETFFGKWKLQTKNILNELEIEIKKNDKNKMIGVVSKLNTDKYVSMFMEVGDIFISQIKRNSNFEFTIRQKKIAAPLFSLYEESTSVAHNATFNNKGEVLLGNKGNSGVLVRIK